MSKYILFAGSHYYPEGGMNDYRGTFNSIEEAKSHFTTVKKSFWGWGQIVKQTDEALEWEDQYFNDRWHADDK